jgi:Single-strand binding protein family
MNNINLVGRLTKDPKMLDRDDERVICELRLAVDNHRHLPTFISIRTYDAHAYACAEFLRKGHRVAVNGPLVYEHWRGEADEFCERYWVIGGVDFLDQPDAERRRQLESEPPYTPVQSREQLLAA